MPLKRVGILKPGQITPIQMDHTFDLPSTFIALDSNVSAADSYVNVRDQFIARQNHNILIAKRCKRNILHELGGTGHRIGQRQLINSMTAPPEKIIPVYLSQHTRQIEIVVRAMQSRTATGDDSDPQMGFQLCSVNTGRALVADEIKDITTAYAASPVGADWGTYAWTLDVPAHDSENCIKHGQLHFNLNMFAYAPIKSSAESSGHAISASDDWWIETGSNTGDRSDKILLIDYGGAGGVIDQRLVHRTVQDKRHFIDSPWSYNPNPGTDTVSTYLAMFILLGSISIYELDSDSLNEQPERA